MKLLFSFFLLSLFSANTFAQGLDTLQLETIFEKPYLSGVRPDIRAFTPDQKHLLADLKPADSSRSDRYKISLRDGDKKVWSSDHPSRFFISPNNKQVAFIDEGDVWISDISFKNMHKLTRTDDREYNLTWSPNSKRLAFVKDGDVWVFNTDPFSITQVTSATEDEPGYYIQAWAGDNDHLIVSQYNNSDHRDVYFPEYEGTFVKPGSSKRGISEVTIKQLAIDSTGSRILLQDKFWTSTITVSGDGQQIVVDRVVPDMKKRIISTFKLNDGDETELFSYETDGWINTGLADLRYNPSGNDLLVLSERDGWGHLYTMNPENGDLKQLTEGEFEVSWARWLTDTKVLFISSEVDPGERHAYTYNLKNDKITRLTQQEGFRDDFLLSDDKKKLVYSYTYWNDPHDIFYLDLTDKNPKEQQLTESEPDRFRLINWQKPHYWRFTGRDGETSISMTALEPLEREEGELKPVIVFVHGAGSLQNVYRGWSENYYREYMFHQWLTRLGYVVVEVDYRHSTGYGRDFREDVTNWMGKYETEDIIDGLDYAQSVLGYLDLDRVGIYGGSYGGFMALYAVSVAPERFHAAAALRAVTNWENYYYANPWYTLPRLGKPDEDKEHYKRSSPLSYADSLTRPVYILHGLKDDNVGFQDAVQYIDKLIQSGNDDFDMMMYPTERHSFQDEDAWIDEYRRIYEFFEEELK
jgi:dipeptidyl aminopeptidase/acylaminoacyl peptidase